MRFRTWLAGWLRRLRGRRCHKAEPLPPGRKWLHPIPDPRHRGPICARGFCLGCHHSITFEQCAVEVAEEAELDRG